MKRKPVRELPVELYRPPVYNRVECNANGCTAEIAPGLLMCPRHWAMVPAAIRTAIGESYRPCQNSYTCTVEWLRAVAEAVEFIALAEGRDTYNHFRQDAESRGKLFHSSSRDRRT